MRHDWRVRRRQERSCYQDCRCRFPDQLSFAEALDSQGSFRVPVSELGPMPRIATFSTWMACESSATFLNLPRQGARLHVRKTESSR